MISKNISSIIFPFLSVFLIGNNSFAQENLTFDCTCSNEMLTTLIIVKENSDEKFNTYEITSPIKWKDVFYIRTTKHTVELAKNAIGTNAITIISPDITDSTFRRFHCGSAFGGGVTTLNNGKAKFEGVTAHSRFFSEIYYLDGSIRELNYYDGMRLYKCHKRN
jgi:hypothetical protein